MAQLFLPQIRVFISALLSSWTVIFMDKMLLLLLKKKKKRTEDCEQKIRLKINIYLE